MANVAESLRARVEDLVKEHKYNDAIAMAREATQREPGNAVYYGVLAFAFNSNGDYGQALDIAKQGIEIDSSCAIALRQCGLAYLRQKEYAQALAYLSRATASDPDVPWLPQARASCCLRLRRYEDALPDLARAYELEPRGAYMFDDRREQARFQQWFQAVHHHFQNELLPLVQASATDRFIEYWPCYIAWGVQAETRLESGTSRTHYYGSVGTGYLCLTTENAYLVSLGDLARKYHPEKGVGVSRITGLGHGASWHWQIEKADELHTVPTRTISSAQELKAMGAFIELQAHSGNYLMYPPFSDWAEYVSRALAWSAAGYPGLCTSAADRTPQPTAQTDTLELLRQLGELKASGILTEEEFLAKKTELLARL